MESSLKNQAYHEIKQKILNCEYAPGTVLNEAFLCKELSFSRTPVRDAISRLEQDHLLRIAPKKGIIIEDITVIDISNYFEVLQRLVQTSVSEKKKYACCRELSDLRVFFSDRQNLEDPKRFCRMLSSLFGRLIRENGNPYYLQMYEQTEYLEQRLLHLVELFPEQLEALPHLCSGFLDESLSGDHRKALESMKKIIRRYQDVITVSYLKTIYRKDSHGREDAEISGI